VALKFDLSVVSSQVTITKAILSLHAFNVFSGNRLKNGPKSLYRFTDHWTNDSLNWMNAPRYTSTAVATNDNSETNVWEEYDVTVEIKKIIEEEAENYGFALALDTCPYGVMYRSSEYETIDKRPKLTITYDENTTIVPQTVKSVGGTLPGCVSLVTVMNVQGQVLASFSTENFRELEHIKRDLFPGVHIITITNPYRKIVKKELFVR